MTTIPWETIQNYRPEMGRVLVMSQNSKGAQEWQGAEMLSTGQWWFDSGRRGTAIGFSIVSFCRISGPGAP